MDEKETGQAAKQSQQAWKKTNTVFTNDKAGMQGVDKDRIKKIIYEMSKVGHEKHCDRVMCRCIVTRDTCHSVCRIHHTSGMSSASSSRQKLG